MSLLQASYSSGSSLISSVCRKDYNTNLKVSVQRLFYFVNLLTPEKQAALPTGRSVPLNLRVLGVRSGLSGKSTLRVHAVHQLAFYTEFFLHPILEPVGCFHCSAATEVFSFER